jgi:hypothetical protein
MSPMRRVLVIVCLGLALWPWPAPVGSACHAGVACDSLIAAQAATIAITQPVPGATVISPLTVRGLERQATGLSELTVSLVRSDTGAVLATTNVPLQQSGSGASFAATLIFPTPPVATAGVVDVSLVGGASLASVAVTISGPVGGAPIIVVTTPQPGATIAGPSVVVQGLETGGSYPGPITVRLINRLSSAVLAAADTNVERPQPGAAGTWQATLSIGRPPDQVVGQIEVLVVFPGTNVLQVVSRIDVTVAGFLSGGQQVAVTSPTPNATVTSPLVVRGLFTDVIPDNALIVRLRDQTAASLLASELAAVQPPAHGQPGAFTARLNFNVPVSGDAGLLEIVIPAGAGGAAAETVVATVPVTVGS